MKYVLIVNNNTSDYSELFNTYDLSEVKYNDNFSEYIKSFRH